MAFDWLLRGGRLSGRDGLWDIALEAGRVAAVAQGLHGEATGELALNGRLVVPGFTNAYLRLPRSADLEGHALLALETALRHGTTAVHVSVDTDPDEPTMPLRLLARVRAQLGDRLAVRLALRLDGADATRSPRGLSALIEMARRAGAEALDIALPPACDGDLLTSLLEPLTETGLALDLEVDAVLPSAQIPPSALTLAPLLDVLEKLPSPPPLRVLHATALAAVHRQALAPWLARLAERVAALVLCPLETLRLSGCHDATAARRGLPRLRELLAAGVPVHLGSGAAPDAVALDPLGEVWLGAYAGHLGTPAALEQLLPLIARGAIDPGAPADLVVLDAPTFAGAVVDHAEKAFVFRAGRLVHRAARVTERVRVSAPDRLIIRQAALLRRGGRHDIVIEDGVIREIAHRVEATGAAIEADGRLVVPAFVDAHLHVDKTFVMDGLALGPANLTVAEAVAAMGRAKAAYTPEDLLRRGRHTLSRALRHGTTAIRAQCDVDPILGLMALEALVALRREFADRLDLQIVAFPQEGLVDNPKAIDLMRRALAAGADAVGGGPLDGDPALHIAQVFALAREAGAPVDIHADLAIDHLRPMSEWEAPLVATHARQNGLDGRVAIGHFASSSALSADEIPVVAGVLADAGVSVAALPASEMYRQGMADAVNSRRGVPRVGDLLEAGVNVAFASNNIRDAFVTFGNADMLEQALLGATAAFLDDMDTALEMVTSRPARLMGLTARDAVAVGKQADLVVLDARTASDAVGDQAEKLAVIRRGCVVVRNRVELGPS